MYGIMTTVKVTLDKAGRLVIPQALHERIGLAGGGTVEIEIDGADLRNRPVAGSRLRKEGDLLVIPRSSVPIDDASVRELVDTDRYRG
jgi:AbrB family looped-hinge helix DNA binding protein